MNTISIHHNPAGPDLFRYRPNISPAFHGRRQKVQDMHYAGKLCAQIKMMKSNTMGSHKLRTGEGGRLIIL